MARVSIAYEAENCQILFIRTHLSWRLWALAKLLSDEFQVVFIEGFFLFAVAMLALPLDYGAHITIGVATVFFLILILIDNETFANLRKKRVSFK